MKTIHLKMKDVVPDEVLAQRLLDLPENKAAKEDGTDRSSPGGLFLNDTFYDFLVQGEDVTVHKPEEEGGEPLLVFKHKVLPADVCAAAFPVLKKAATPSYNRGMAAGAVPGRRWGNNSTGKAKLLSNGIRNQPIKLDGTLSNTNYSQEVNSGIIGYFDRNARFPYCRMTAFNLNFPEKFARAVPFIKAVDEVFQRETPERYAAQMKYVKKTSQDFVIEGTAFTTVTVNKDWRTAIHKDAGDLKQGFGVMSALRAGKFKGCYLCFPRYRVAVDMCTQDVLLADLHSLHGNTPLVGIKGLYTRISTVLYVREKMAHCGSAEFERERVKHRKKGDKINDV